MYFSLCLSRLDFYDSFSICRKFDSLKYSRIHNLEMDRISSDMYDELLCLASNIRSLRSEPWAILQFTNNIEFDPIIS